MHIPVDKHVIRLDHGRVPTVADPEIIQGGGVIEIHFSNTKRIRIHQGSP